MRLYDEQHFDYTSFTAWIAWVLMALHESCLLTSDIMGKSSTCTLVYIVAY